VLTTATMRIRKDFRRNIVLKSLVVVYIAVWILAAINPVYPADWLLENVLVAVFVPLIVLTYRKFPLSEVSYAAITIFMIGHAVGAHYTYAEVPLGFWAYYFPLDVTLAFSAVYEIIEMIVARVVSPGAGDAYLGTQGDPFDGIMDMAMAFAGSAVCMSVVALARGVTGKGPYLLEENDEDALTGAASTRS